MSGNPTIISPATLSQKVWDAHVVHEEPGAPSLIYVDLHLVHEVTSPQAFQGLRERGLKVRRPDLTIATTDHSIPTTDRSLPILDPIAAKQITQLETELPGIRHLALRRAFDPSGHRARDRAGTGPHAAGHDGRLR